MSLNVDESFVEYRAVCGDVKQDCVSLHNFSNDIFQDQHGAEVEGTIADLTYFAPPGLTFCDLHLRLMRRILQP